MSKPTRCQQPSPTSIQHAANPRQTRTPQAPPPYRPQSVPRCLQTKSATPLQPPSAYRPQPTPKVSQGKTATTPRAQTEAGHTVPSTPPVYRPQTAPKCLQPKTETRQPPSVGRERNAAVAPPAYRTQSGLKVLQPKSAKTQPSAGVIQRMESRRRESLADTIGTYEVDEGQEVGSQFNKLRLKVGTLLYHSSNQNLAGKQLNSPAFLSGAGETTYGRNSFSFKVTREVSLILLNDLGNIRMLLEEAGGKDTAVGAALIKKAGVHLDNHGKAMSFSGVKTASGDDKYLAAWFSNHDAGWYIDASKSGGMDFNEVMLTDTACLEPGKKVRY